MRRALGSLRRAARRVRREIAPRGVILMYHRVAEVRPDPWSLCVSPAHFAEHLDVIRRVARPTRLEALPTAVRGIGRSRPVVVTFDDGYRDNLENAKPALERADVPAALFVTTGTVGDAREYWWDELESVVLGPGELPETLQIELGGVRCEWSLGAAAQYDEAGGEHDWTVASGTAPTPRHGLFRELYDAIYPLAPVERRRVVDDLLAWAGRPATPRATHAHMSVDELRALAAGGLIELGAHTASHPALTSLGVEQQRAEIVASRDWLRETLNVPAATFAYPHGDYSAETVDVVRAAGFSCACSCATATVTARSDPFQLPRFGVPDVDGDRFAGLLAEWFAM